MKTNVEGVRDVVRAKKARRLPVVLIPAEVKAVLSQLESPCRLLAELMYGSGLRLLESVRLRVKEVDFERREILIRDGKGRRDRVSVLPERAAAALRTQLQIARALHDVDLSQGCGSVFLPAALARKCRGAGSSQPARRWGGMSQPREGRLAQKLPWLYLGAFDSCSLLTSAVCSE